ncbi:hypothetical protein ACIQGZ_12535 [Streptomyces sp. NPDC092296]|uniref:hypothetical protein n=1 Tax=Streptomyces sp. NPDC092296 TaxID=3366012 RepID=UPI003812A91D
MRIVVVDNVMQAGEAVARALDGTGHEVAWALTPEVLAGMLDGQRFDLAFVDLDFGRMSEQSGLAALRQLAARSVRSVVYSADSEDSRLLFLLAAFQFHRPLGLLTKEAPGAEIRELVRAAEAGERLRGALSGDRYRPPAHGTAWLDRLIPSTTDLAVWEQLPYYSSRWELARTAHVSERTVDKFLLRHAEAVRELERVFRRRPEPPFPAAPGDRRARSPLLAPLHAFAVTHFRFFRDPEVRPLIEARRRPGRGV